MGLQQYREKRNFKETPEPRGASQSSSERLQFVIQQHAASRLHYDFRLELAGTLKSWAIPKGPSLDPAHKRLAVHVEDHPLDYGGFEGIIPPKQYGAGTVLLWDRGSWSPVGDAMASYRRGRLKFNLKGHKLRGLWNLVRMGGRHEQGKENWLLIKEKDDEARTGEQAEITQFLTNSVASRRTMEQIASGCHRVWRSNRPAAKRAKSVPRPHETETKQLAGARRTAQEDWIRPQLATLADEAPVGEEWVHELKYDGYRILCRVKNGSAKLVTRNDHDWTAKLQSIASAAAALPVKTAWLDGEVVALRPDGVISFQGLQNAFDTGSEANLVYYIFDLLYLDGYDLRQVALLDRKRSLAAMMPHNASGLLRYSDHIQGQGEVVFSEACRRRMEGIVSKRTDATYVGSRNRNWIKVKCGRRQEFVIGGFTDPSGSRVAFGALLLGVYDGQGRFQFVGRTGTGFSERSLKELHKRLVALKQPRSPFVNPPSGVDARGVHWVKPRLVAEVSFAEWTNEGLLRQAAFQGLREDKAAKSVIKEGTRISTPVRAATSAAAQTSVRRHAGTTRSPAKKHTASAEGPATVAGVTVSHPNRIIFPDQGFTKLALAQYYARVSPWLLPHLQDRPLTLVRCPKGYNKDCFYQKHATGTVPDTIDRVEIPEEHGVSWYMIADSLPAVIGLVQMGVLELHTWGAKRDKLDRPDRIIMDLDPDPTVPWKFVIEAAQLVRTLLNELELECFVKTTGGKGLHVVLPLRPVHTWDEVKAFSKGLADHLVRLIPDRFIANMSKQKRKGKIYVDYLRNIKGATAIAAYSTRARPEAPVSVPLSWEELSVDVRSDHFTVDNVVERLNGLKQDPWRDYFTVKQKLTRKMNASLGVSS
ncbi:MAG TPA: DNA ligase D [Nitrospiraceae bacterium]|nr:DNA ligase D [Nitrospiraceae bacterium]